MTKIPGARKDCDRGMESTKKLQSEPVSHTRLRLQKCQEDISGLSAQFSALALEILSLTE